VTTNYPFTPVQSTENVIKGLTRLTPGCIYFATDTGKIYLDTEAERLSVGGGGVEILYAAAKDVVQDLTDSRFPYKLYLSDLKDKSLIPKVDDLIINSDGKFFKVMSYEKSTELIKCELLAISGSGNSSGGSSSGGGDSSSDRRMELVLEDLAPNVPTYIYGKS
jgi:hypothetical protein